MKHLYGLPKIHKNATDPPLRPIISNKQINSWIRPHLNNQYIIKTSDELLLKLETLQLQLNQKLSSLDVESLFTNVPVTTTIDIIIDAAYHHNQLPPPPIDEQELRQLLTICTSETAFQYSGKTFLQTDGVSMGSPLGPTFADFYMSILENYALSQDKISNPIFYVRYVDDILTVFRSNNHLSHFKRRLISNSILNFTHETMLDDNFHFLDVNTHLSNNRITTSVYIKPTNNGPYIDFKSYTLDQYKVSTIKTLVYRALKLSSTWTETILDINRLKQIFANCNYPQAIVDKTVRICMDKYIIVPLLPTKILIITPYPFMSNFITFQLSNQIAKPLNQ